MFFDIFCDLCARKGVSPNKAAGEIGLSNSITTKWKKTGATPGGDTLHKIAAYFGVPVFYLRGESEDGTRMEDWMDGAFLDEPAAPAPKVPERPAAKPAGGEPGGVFDAFLRSKKFQESLHTAVLEVLRSPEGRELLSKAVRKELSGGK